MSQQENNYVAGQLMPLDPDLGWLAGEFVYIPAGEFMMGSEEYHHLKPIHKVIISCSFEMGRYQVTQKQWQAVMGSSISHFKGDNLPVDHVSWLDVKKFMNKLNKKSKLYLYMLPTEAQWEYACRGGTIGNYAGNLDAVAWYDSNSESKTHSVGQKLPNAWGLYDMLGNVWEWCLDRYGTFLGVTVTDPNGAASGGFRVARGGSYDSLAISCLPANRISRAPDPRYSDMGFRLIRNTK